MKIAQNFKSAITANLLVAGGILHQTVSAIFNGQNTFPSALTLNITGRLSSKYIAGCLEKNLHERYISKFSGNIFILCTYC